MRVLTEEEAKKMDIEFIYREGNVVALVDVKFPYVFGEVLKYLQKKNFIEYKGGRWQITEKYHELPLLEGEG